MSEHAHPTAAPGDPVTLETGLEALQSSPEFRGPVEALDGHHCNDHFAQIYETDAERFAAAVPFVRHGLEEDERVMYVVEEHREEAVRAALRDGGIDVDAALDSGELSFHTAEETYLRNGSFEPDEMIEFYADTVAAATAEYEALRIVAETTWLEADVIPFEQFMEYEAKVNQLFDAENCLALCQYDRNGFPPEFIRSIVQSHPHLIYDGAACHNVYYTPPAEVFDDDPAREVDRMLGTLRERTEAKAELQQRDRFLQELYAITADQTRSFEEKVHALLDLGCERFGLDVGGLNRVDPDANRFEVEYLNGDHECFEPGMEFPLSDTYCQAAADIEAAATVSTPVEEGFDDIPVFEEFGIEGYIGTYIPVDGGTDRTLGFLPAESEPVSFSEQDRMYLELMGQWVGYELNRRQRERFLRKCYEITSDPEPSFEEKLHGLFELGCERFGLDIGGLSKVDPDTDLFEVEAVNGDHEYFEPGARAELSETYCRLVTEDGDTAAVIDPVDAGFEGNRCYGEFGVQAYLGTHLTVSGGPDRTFWFVSTEPRETPITDEERTFVHLMGQWVKYELERSQRERELEQKNDRLESFASLLAHELRNPVTIGQIYSQQLPAETDADAVEYVTEAFDRIEDMVDVLLILTRGREAIDERTPVDLASVARKAWDTVDAPDAAIDIELDRTIQADETYVRHLFRNLLENAVEHGSTSNQPSADDAVEHGGADVTVTVGELPTGFYVADDGTGIPPEDRAVIFDEGYTTNADNGGTGLGLAFVRKLAEVYEWDCAVTESADGGARFEFRDV